MSGEGGEGAQGVFALVPRLRAPCRNGALSRSDSLFELLIGRNRDMGEDLFGGGVDDRGRSWRGGRFAIYDVGTNNVGMCTSVSTRRGS